MRVRALKMATESANGYSLRACKRAWIVKDGEAETDQQCLARQMEKLKGCRRAAGVRVKEVEH